MVSAPVLRFEQKAMSKACADCAASSTTTATSMVANEKPGMIKRRNRRIVEPTIRSFGAVPWERGEITRRAHTTLSKSDCSVPRRSIEQQTGIEQVHGCVIAVVVVERRPDVGLTFWQHCSLSRRGSFDPGYGLPLSRRRRYRLSCTRHDPSTGPSLAPTPAPTTTATPVPPSRYDQGVFNQILPPPSEPTAQAIDDRGGADMTAIDVNRTSRPLVFVK